MLRLAAFLVAGCGHVHGPLPGGASSRCSRASIHRRRSPRTAAGCCSSGSTEGSRYISPDTSLRIARADGTGDRELVGRRIWGSLDALWTPDNLVEVVLSRAGRERLRPRSGDPRTGASCVQLPVAPARVVAERQLDRLRRRPRALRRSARTARRRGRWRAAPELGWIGIRRVLARLDTPHVCRRPVGRARPVGGRADRRHRPARPPRGSGRRVRKMVSGRQRSRSRGAERHGPLSPTANVGHEPGRHEPAHDRARLLERPRLVAQRRLDRLRARDVDQDARSPRAHDRAAERNRSTQGRRHRRRRGNMARRQSAPARGGIRRVPAFGHPRDRRLRANRQAADEPLPDRRDTAGGQSPRNAAARPDRRARRCRQDRRRRRRRSNFRRAGGRHDRLEGPLSRHASAAGRVGTGYSPTIATGSIAIVSTCAARRRRRGSRQRGTPRARGLVAARLVLLRVGTERAEDLADPDPAVDPASPPAPCCKGSSRASR